jgi:solute carrier family 25 iron transporter 28/37
MIMVSTNEYLKHYLTKESQMPATTSTYLLAGCGAGAVASAVTTPLDRIKTRLQTQTMGSAMVAMETQVSAVASNSGAAAAAAANCEMKAFSAQCHKSKAVSSAVRYHGWVEAGQSIVRTEGMMGLFRGLTPRVVTHMPAVAISWTTYETVKRWLVSASA